MDLDLDTSYIPTHGRDIAPPLPNPERWPDLAAAISLGVDDKGLLAQQFSTTIGAIDWLQTKVPVFAQLLEEARKSHKNITGDALFVARARRLAAKHLNTVDLLLSDRQTNDGVKAKLFETLVRLARLEPTKDETGNAAPSVIINLDSLGGRAPPAPPATTIEHPQPPVLNLQQAPVKNHRGN